MTGFSSEKREKRIRNNKTHYHHEASDSHKQSVQIKNLKHQYELESAWEDEDDYIETDDYQDSQLEEEWLEYQKRQQNDF